MKELELINKEIDEFRLKLKKKPEDINELKSILNDISIILNISMVMEFKISEVAEKFRTLKLYK